VEEVAQLSSIATHLLKGGVMNTETFLKKLLSNEGNYCVFAARAEDDRRVQKFYTSIEEVVDASETFDKDGFDVYFGLATFEDDQSRRIDNVKHLKSFFLDLDCGPSKDFSTQEQAISELQKFCKTNKLPKPILVNSGRGIHVYWPLEEPVCYADWLPVATRLKKLCVDHNFAADPAITADAARILRIVNTHNNKGGVSKPVTVISTDSVTPLDFDNFSALLGGDMIPVPAVYTPMELDETTQLLIGNQETCFKDILKKTFSGEGCQQLEYIMLEQESMPEPLWRAGLSIAKFCTDAATAVNKISEKYPEYDPYETQKKAALIKGPYTCAKFDEFNPGVCTGCPNWGKIKSPILLGRRLREAEVSEDGVYVDTAKADPAPDEIVYEIPEYPKPYIRGANGGVYRRDVSPDGIVDEKLIYRNDIYLIKRIRDPLLKDCVVGRIHLRKDGVREFVIPMSSVTSREEFRKVMSGEGVTLNGMQELMTYMLTWVDKLQDTVEAEDAHIQFGWTDDMKEFIVGKRKISAHKVESNPASTQTAVYMPFFEPKGTYEEWRENMKLWNGSKFVVQQFGLGIGFGSPLVQFLSEHCATFLFYSHTSGLGKTLIQYAGAGIYGHPESLVTKIADTSNFLFNRAEVYHSIPFGVDEMTNENAKQVSDFIYQTTSGQQKGRMSSSSNVERIRGRPWHLLMTLSSNESILDKLNSLKAAPQAEAQRIIECPVEPIFDKVQDKPITGPFEASIKNCYGHAAVPYIQYILQNMEQCKDIVLETQRRVDAKASLTNQNRFWSSGISCALAGLVIAKRAGLHDFDIKPVYEWATTSLLEHNKTGIRQMELTAEDIIGEFFAEHYNSILVIKSNIDARSSAGDGFEQYIIPDQVARANNLVARYEPDTKKFFVRTSALKSWCVERSIIYNDLIGKINKFHKGVLTRKHLTKGTKLELPSIRVIQMEIVLEDAGTGDPS
jgi:hypothetical protein